MAQATVIHRIVRTGRGTFLVEDGSGAADVTVSGAPATVLRWVWNGDGPDGPAGLTMTGAEDAIQLLKQCIVTATQ